MSRELFFKVGDIITVASERVRITKVGSVVPGDEVFWLEDGEFVVFEAEEERECIHTWRVTTEMWVCVYCGKEQKPAGLGA